jgi:hypothetical protein
LTLTPSIPITPTAPITPITPICSSMQGLAICP